MRKNSLKSKKPLVAIVVRTKNEEKTIGKVLNALVEQTFKDFEIVLVDDNSIDKTLETVKKFSKKLPIKIINLKPGEFSHPFSLNLGAAKAKEQYLCFLVGHALPMSNNWLADGLANFQNHQVAGISGHYTENPVGYYSRALGQLLFRWEGFLRKKRVDFDPWMSNTNSIIRKDLWEKYPFDEKLPECEDYDWACEMLARGFNIIKDSKFSVFHSHWYIGRPGYSQKLPTWRKLCAMIDKRKRPRRSYTRIKYA